MNSNQILDQINIYLKKKLQSGLGKKGLIFPIDIKNIEDDHLKDICKRLSLIFEMITESYHYSEQMSLGIFNSQIPRQNIFAMPLKALQAGLAHLTWQVNQIAEGDLNQQVHFLGTFSTSFNKMITSLKEKKFLEQQLIEKNIELKKALQKFEQAESLQKKTDDRHRFILDKINEGIILKSAAGEILTWNKGAENIFGIPAKNIIGKSSKIIDQQTFFENELKYEGKDHPSMITLKTGTPCKNIVMGVKNSSDELHWILINTNPLFQNDSQKPYAVIISFSDITAFKQIQDDLRNSKSKLQRTLDATADGIWSWNFKTNDLYFSPKYYKMLGYIPNEFSANFENWINLLHPDDSKTALKIANKFLANKPDIYENEFRLRTKNGDYRWIRAVAKVVERDENGKAVYMIGNHIDTTEKKRLEKQFQQTQKMDAIGTLAGGIAHDFNNMLGVITGNISYALSHLNKNDDLYNVLIDVQESSKQAQGLTYQLLTFSKGGTPIKKVSDINKIIREAAIFTIRGAKSKCNFELLDNLWSADIDEGQINQVIQNLIINANQAMPNGGTIFVQTQNLHIKPENIFSLPSGRYIKIIVEDQGIGISKKHLSKIFEPYFTTKQKGSGLGLATTYSIIKKHEGHITVHSKFEKGTIFNIYLPASSNGIKNSKNKPKLKHKGQGKILVMDDQEPILKMVGRILKRLGYEAALAVDGNQAIEMYRKAFQQQKSFDLVILDLTIPGGMGGAETIIELLKIDPQVKAIVSSGYSNDPIMSNHQEYGFCDVIPKPYTQSELSKILNKYQQAFCI